MRASGQCPPFSFWYENDGHHIIAMMLFVGIRPNHHFARHFVRAAADCSL